MMDFMIIVAGVTVAYLLVGAIAIAIMFNKKVQKWYIKHVMKLAKDMTEMMVELEDEEL